MGIKPITVQIKWQMFAAVRDVPVLTKLANMHQQFPQGFECRLGEQKFLKKWLANNSRTCIQQNADVVTAVVCHGQIGLPVAVEVSDSKREGA